MWMRCWNDKLSNFHLPFYTKSKSNFFVLSQVCHCWQKSIFICEANFAFLFYLTIILLSNVKTDFSNNILLLTNDSWSKDLCVDAHWLKIKEGGFMMCGKFYWIPNFWVLLHFLSSFWKKISEGSCFIPHYGPYEPRSDIKHFHFSF